jgi:DNA topoisomerase-2
VKVDEFLNTKLVNYASYDNIRSISSCIDGLKNGARKVLYTVHEKKIRDKTKVSQLSSKCAEFSDYLHGDVSLQGVLVTLGQDYPGTNNIPLLQKYGNFGTRSAQRASAARYIFARGSDAFFELFKYEDDPILDEQYFEGYKIEPKFYVPTLPMLVVNGSEGISTGFSQKILPRNPKNVRDYIVRRLRDKSVSEDLLYPWYNGFSGTIVKDVDRDRWVISGNIEHVKKNEYLITEVPLHYDLTSYISVLDDLKDNGKILKYSNESDGNNILQFRIWMPKNYEYNASIYDVLKLRRCITENFTSIDENNKIREFSSIGEIVEHYIGIKLKYVSKRKEYLLDKYRKDLSILESKMKFIIYYIENKISIHKKSKDEIIQQLESFSFPRIDDSYSYLLSMPIYALTEEKISSLSNDINTYKQQIETLSNKTSKDIWMDELNKLKL